MLYQVGRRKVIRAQMREEALRLSRLTKRMLVVVGAVFVALLGLHVTLHAANNVPGTDPNNQQASNPIQSEVKNPVVTITTESGGEIKIELYPDVAPNTVYNFIALARKGFYDGTIFHRVIPGFMIQGGDPEGTGRGGPGYFIKGEFLANGFRNTLRHTRGVVSMARAAHPDSAGSQFFIMVADAPHLDGSYAAFGKVISGMEEVDRIVSVPRNAQDRPLTPQRMVKVTVEDFGIEYPEPKTIRR